MREFLHVNGKIDPPKTEILNLLSPFDIIYNKSFSPRGKWKTRHNIRKQACNVTS